MEWIPIKTLPLKYGELLTDDIYLKVNGAKRIGYFDGATNKWYYLNKKTDLHTECKPTHWAKK